jgi:hypothetical protein
MRCCAVGCVAGAVAMATRETNYMSSYFRDRSWNAGRAARAALDAAGVCTVHAYNIDHVMAIIIRDHAGESRLASSRLIHLHLLRLVAHFRLARAIVPFVLALLCYIVLVLFVLDGTR